MTIRRRLRILAPLRHRDYRLLAFGSLCSLLGDGVFLVALPLQVYALSNIPTAMGVVGLVWSGSQVATLLLGGWASDRFERRRIMLAADVLRALALGGIGVLSLVGGLELWHVVVLGSVVGASNGFFNPAATSIVPDLLPEDDLPQANAFLGVARPAMVRLLGPALGGLVVGLTGPAGAFLLDAATFLVSGALLARIRRQPPERDERADQQPPELVRTLQQVREGFGFVRRHTWCWVWIAGAALALLAFTGPVDMLLPFVLKNDMGLERGEPALALGMILSAGGVGAIVVSLLVGQLGLPKRFVTWMYVVQGLGVAMLGVYGVMTEVWQAVVANVLLNGAFAYADIAWTTLLQREVPRRLLGRVSSLDWLTSLGLMPLSFAVAGPLAVAFGARTVLLVGAVLGSLTVLALMFVPGARAPERRNRARAASRAADAPDTAVERGS